MAFFYTQFRLIVITISYEFGNLSHRLISNLHAGPRTHTRQGSTMVWGGGPLRNKNSTKNICRTKSCRCKMPAIKIIRLRYIKHKKFGRFVECYPSPGLRNKIPKFLLDSYHSYIFSKEKCAINRQIIFNKRIKTDLQTWRTQSS